MDNTEQRTMKSFWERKEGTAGMLTLALMGVGALFAAKALLPTIISVLTMGTVALGQLWMMALLASSLGAFLWILFGTKLPRLLGFYFKAVIRRATGVFVAVYPIEIMQEFISKLISKKELFSEKKADISKVKRNISETIKANEREKQDALFKVKAAEKQNMPMEVQLAARQAGMLDDAIKRLNASLSTIDKLYTGLERVEKVCDFKIRDMQFQVKMLDQENKTSKAIKGAVAAGRAILLGADADQELYDMATEYVVEDYRNSLGLVDDFMSSTESILNGFDLQNGMWEERALEQLTALEGKEQMLLSKAPTANVVQPIVITPVMDHAPLPSTDLTAKYLK
jgi:uncharacterized protein YeeX (DUF496 family)